MLFLGALIAEALAVGPELSPAWWIAAPIQSVQIESPSGGVPEESLDPLLRARQGVRLDPALVRLDIATLFNAGEFLSVEADVEPWVDFGEDGTPTAAVILKYRVRAAPRLGRITVEGADHLGERPILDHLGMAVGDAFYPDVDPNALASRARELYKSRGFPDAQAHVDSRPMRRSERVEMILTIREGQPTRTARVIVTGDSPLTRRDIRRAMRRANIRNGYPLTAEQIATGQSELRAALVRDHACVEARITPSASESAPGQIELNYFVEPGKPLDLDVTGLWPLPNPSIRKALSIDERMRLTKGFVEDAPDRLESWLARRGYPKAIANVSIHETPAKKTLRVSIQRGPRHFLLARFGGGYRIDFTGNQNIGASDLRDVMIQSSPEVLRLGWVTEPAVIGAIHAAEDMYKTRGYANAKVVHLGPELRTPRISLWRMPFARGVRRWLGFEPPVNVALRFEITEGLVTSLEDLLIEGAAPDVDLAAIEVQRAAATGKPWSPQRIDQLAQAIGDAHRSVGYLDVETQVVHAARDHAKSSTIVVRPGPKVLLRSTVITGAQATHTDFLRDQLTLALGQPLTAADLENTRSRIYDLGTFRTVSTNLIGDGAARDLVVHVTERPRYSFELGAGVSTDQGLRGFSRINRTNLWGVGHRLTLFGSASLRYQNDLLTDWRLDLSDPQGRAAATYTAPHFPTRRQTSIIDILFREEIQERTWRFARTGPGLSLEAKTGDHTTLRGALRFEGRRLLQLDLGTLLPGEPWAALLVDGALPLPSAWREQHTASFLLLHDRRDDPLQPTRGLLLSVLGEYSPRFTLGLAKALPASSYFEGSARVTGYIPVGGTVLHLSAEGARTRVFSGGVLALEDRYRLGGTGSLRGYGRYSAGPRNEVSQPDIDWPSRLQPILSETESRYPTRWVSTGGDTKALASAEWLIPLPMLGLQSYQGYSAAVFTDVGNVWLLDATATSELPQYTAIFNPVLRVGVGLGLRVGTPVGPLQIDLGVNPQAAFATGERKQLLRDEWAESSLRGHLSLGSLF